MAPSARSMALSGPGPSPGSAAGHLPAAELEGVEAAGAQVEVQPNRAPGQSGQERFVPPRHPQVDSVALDDSAAQCEGVPYRSLISMPSTRTSLGLQATSVRLSASFALTQRRTSCR